MSPDPSRPVLDEAIAVFEGGGVRGLAYLGAYAAALRHNVRFYGAAGTSVGSIAAALVAAGLDAEAITEIHRRIEPQKDLLCEPDRRALRERGLMWHLLTGLPIPGSLPRRLVKFGTHLGLYSSERIYEWLDAILFEHLRHRTDIAVDRPVRFKHLPNHLAVFATNISDCTPRVWTTLHDPEMDVARAVQCSCAIPVYFQPVWVEASDGRSSAYIDGGVIANLPLHVLKEFPDLRHLPILAFRLNKEPEEQFVRGNVKFPALLRRTIEAVVWGNSVMQLYDNPRVATVDIETEGVSSLNFEMGHQKRDALFQAGFRACDTLLTETQHSILRTPQFGAAIVQTSRSSVLDWLALAVRTSAASICGFLPDGRTLMDLIPAILLLRKETPGVSVRLLYHDGLTNEALVWVADALGCEIRRSPKPLYVRAFIRDADRPSAEAVIVESPAPGRDADGEARSVRVLRAPPRSDDPLERERYGMIRLLQDHFDHAWLAATPEGAPRTQVGLDPRLPTWEDTFRAIKRVDQYADPRVKIYQGKMRPADLHPLQRALESWRVRRVEEVARVCEQYTEHGVAFCDFAFLSGSTRVSIPPVVEVWPNGERTEWVVVRGNHRVFWAWRNFPEQAIPVIVVEGVVHSLPGEPLPSWDLVRVLPHIAGNNTRYKNYRPGDERRIGNQLDALGRECRVLQVGGDQEVTD